MHVVQLELAFFGWTIVRYCYDRYQLTNYWTRFYISVSKTHWVRDNNRQWYLFFCLFLFFFVWLSIVKIEILKQKKERNDSTLPLSYLIIIFVFFSFLCRLQIDCWISRVSCLSTHTRDGFVVEAVHHRSYFIFVYSQSNWMSNCKYSNQCDC